jgi:hypothetical protein
MRVSFFARPTLAESILMRYGVVVFEDRDFFLHQDYLFGHQTATTTT